MSKEINDVSRGDMKKFKWSRLLSDFTNARTKQEREKSLISGMVDNVPYEKDMVKEWQPPYLFFRFFLIGLAVTIAICLSNVFFEYGSSLLVGIAPFLIPITVMLFFWELNIPRNISLFDTLLIMLCGAAAYAFISNFIVDVTGLEMYDSADYIIPLLNSIVELLVVCLFLNKKSRGYGLNGVLIGAAVGAGMVSVSSTELMLNYVEVLRGADYGFEMIMALTLVNVLAMGSHAIWVATFGGALALAKGKNKISFNHFGNPMFLICFMGTYLMEVLWGYNLSSLFSRFTDLKSMMTLYRILEVYQGKRILLIIIAWALLLFIARKCIEESIHISAKARDEESVIKKKIQASFAGEVNIFGISGACGGKMYSCTAGVISFGRAQDCSVKYSTDEKGISSHHCEIRKQGDGFVLIDKGSSYGTFLSDGTKLEGDKPYKLKEGDEFYLTNPENYFKVAVKNEAANLDVIQKQMNYSIRTNEPLDDTKGKNVIIACSIVFLFIFLVLYLSFGTESQNGYGEGVEQQNNSIEGVWVTDSNYDVKEIIINNIDNIATILDIGMFKESTADGITFTQDGHAYCTKNGKMIDYAGFTYRQIDDSTIHLQWEYNAMEASANFGTGMVGVEVSKNIGDSTGYDASYRFDEDGYMYLDFFNTELKLDRR